MKSYKALTCEEAEATLADWTSRSRCKNQGQLSKLENVQLVRLAKASRYSKQIQAIKSKLKVTYIARVFFIT